MKHLIIYNKHYRDLLQDFSLYVERVGYNKGSQTALPSCVQEFFHWLEQKGINQLAQITPELIRKHYDYLGERPNYNRGGNLSDSMINHHIYALKTFMNYQEQQGRMAQARPGTLPKILIS